MRKMVALVSLLSVAGAAPATAAPIAAAAAFPGPDVRMEVLNLPSAPPGKAAASPGGGVVTTPAVLYLPAKGENIHGPAIVMLDRGPGSNPIRTGQSTRFAAQRLAARGYTVLSLYSLLERGYSLFPFEATGDQIDAAISFLEQRGHEDIVLAGNGYGAIAAANYLATHADEPIDSPGTKRVKAVILFSPLTELRDYPRAGLTGPDYAAKSAAAAKSVAAGRGSYPPGNTVEVGSGPKGDVDPWVAAGPYNGPAEEFLSYWSPAAAARNERLLAAIKVPTLVVGAGKDPTYSTAHLKRIVGAAPVEVATLAGADAGFTGFEDQAAALAGSFLDKHKLAVPVGVTQSVIDVTAANGLSLPAVVYAPEGGADPAKPTYMMIHGRGGDALYASNQWLGWRLAQRGYTVITPAFRISGAAGFASSNMAEQADDMGRWMDAVAKAGYNRIIPVGHSNGGIYTSIYMSKTHDPRVVGVVFMAPTINEREHTPQRLGQATFERQLAEAKAAIDQGEGQTHMIGFLTAQTYWDVNNPHTLGMHTDRIKEYSVPTLSIIGRHDALFKEGDFVTRFMANQKPGKAKLVWLENGSHGMRESKDEVVDDIVAWTRQTYGK